MTDLSGFTDAQIAGEFYGRALHKFGHRRESLTTRPERLMPRAAGYHDIRLDGILDLTLRANGASVLDLGCNGGMVSFELANNGATLVHGCDCYKPGVQTAQTVFAAKRLVESQFELLDLTGGAKVLVKAFGERHYDIILMLATYHKLARQMATGDLYDLVRYLGDHTDRYFAWRGKKEERELLDRLFKDCGLRRIQFSEISQPDMEPAGIWGRDV